MREVLLMGDRSDYSGEHFVVLPKDYLSSAKAVSEIYDDELTEAVSDLRVDSLRPDRSFFQGTLTAIVIWIAPSTWMVCL